MRKLRTFKCSDCDHSETVRADDGVDFIKCSECGGESKLTLSAPKYFGNSVGRSPSAM